MKNIADVNSEDILSELNNLDYDDLKLLDDEEIKPIATKAADDDLADFYMGYDTTNEHKLKNDNRINLYTEKALGTDKPSSSKEQKNEKVEIKVKDEKTVVKKSSSVDDYLNRPVVNRPTAETVNYEPPKHVAKDMTNPLINRVKPVETNQNTTTITASANASSMTKGSTPDNSMNDIKDLNQLFNKVSNNVKDASKVINRSAEIKRKIDERFEELRRLQQEHEANKKSDYAQINAYKEEVYTKLQQKKADIENDLAELRINQEKLNKEKQDFEAYKETSMSNLKKLEDELKKSYDSRNRDIEQVELGLVKRKEQLDKERASLAKEREQIEKDRANLADNLVQFNKLVDDFTNGINSF